MRAAVTAVIKEVELRFAVYYRGEFAASAALLAAGGINPGTFVTGSVDLGGGSDAFARLPSSTSERKILVSPNG